MAKPLKTWRQARREDHYWERARARSEVLSRNEVVEYIETTVMLSGQAISRYRQFADNPEARGDQLLELRMNLEAALGMLDNLLTRRERVRS